jgi:hypothetical protein
MVHRFTPRYASHFRYIPAVVPSPYQEEAALRDVCGAQQRVDLTGIERSLHTASLQCGLG